MNRIALSYRCSPKIVVKEDCVHKGGFIMNGEIKAKYNYKCNKKKSYKKIVVMISLILILGIFGRVTPIRQWMATGFERVLIYIDEYSDLGKVVESDPPIIDDLKITVLKNIDTSQYKTIIKQKEDLYKGSLILVNSKYKYQSPSAEGIRRVIRIKNRYYKVADKKMFLHKTMINQLNKMMKAFEKATDKHDMILTSGYRTIEEQEEALQEKIELYGEEEALKWAMLPGYSEHHTGYAVDMSIYTDQGNYIKYKGQDEYGWINQNCHKYGLIRRYAGDKKDITGVSNEEWHYRYIGVPHSYIVVGKDFCFEEYIAYLKQYKFDETHLCVECEQGKYEIYFVPYEGEETEVPIPINKKYNVLGNNIDGFIVTVKC